MIRPIGILVVVALLTGCESPAPTQSAVATTAAPIQVSANAKPGTTRISAARAATVFGDLCVATRPSHAGMEGPAARHGFVWNSRFGTYYHPQENLSVKLVDGTCSMVFQSTAAMGDLQPALAALGAGIQLKQRSFGDQTIYNARLSAG